MNITTIRTACAAERPPVVKDRGNYAHAIAASSSHDQTTTNELWASEHALLHDKRLTREGISSIYRTALNKVQAELNRRA